MKTKVRWYPGTGKGHLVKTKKTGIKLWTSAKNVSILTSLKEGSRLTHISGRKLLGEGNSQYHCSNISIH